MKKGLSFTLTLVVVGVILLMTALSVITLGGSSLNQFFETFSGEREEAIQQNEIRSACQDKMQRIDREYCNAYIHSHDYVDGSDAHASGSGDNDNIYDYSDYQNESGDEWERNPDSSACSDYRELSRPRGFDAAMNDETDGSASYGEAYDQTARERGCDWVQGFGENPTVEVQGQTFDCVSEGAISDTRCPAQ